MSNYSYYIYSKTLIRQSGLKMEVLDHRTKAWKEISHAAMRKRVQEEGVEIFEEHLTHYKNIFYL